MPKLKPIAEVVFPSGAIRVSDIINGRRISVQYFGYTKADAVKQFMLDSKEKSNA